MVTQIALLCTVVSSLVAQASPPQHANEPHLSDDAVAAMVRSVREGENWIHEVDGLLIRFEGGWTHTPKSIEMNRKRLAGLAIDGKLDPNRFPTLKPKTTETLELAFDKNRIRRYHENHGYRREESYWDGSRALSKIEDLANQGESYVIDTKPHRLVGNYYFADISWLRAGPHTFWWRDPKLDQPIRFWGHADQFTYKGRESYRGIDCHVLENDNGPFKIRWYVSIDMGQLIRHMTIDGESRREYWQYNYNEIAPGKWLPMTQGYSVNDLDDEGNIYESAQRELKVVEVQINPDLKDEMFDIKISEGAKVTDYTHDPWLFYRYKKGMSEEEWKAILKEADERREFESAINAARQKLIGKTAPPFPKGVWINSQPMTWKDLAGKVVVLDFWSTTCGPCRAHLPQMNEFNKLRDKTNVVVIGIHSAERDASVVEKFVKEHKFEYPIFVETRGNAPDASFGKLFDDFAVAGIPHTAIVDKDGYIAQSGGSFLEPAWSTARGMANSTN
ncbi:MAG TPA: TlpA disulfide reductase family protein [Phycisphaerae bacterium]|nr:TlpA disulfide reductase family protein [Phycisphaerae bacterium]